MKRPLAALLLALAAAPTTATAASAIEEGKKLAFSVTKGNCLACHMIIGGEAFGNLAPPLIAMSQRYPDKKQLHKQIYDATVANPETTMPPFGRHKILSDAEIGKIVEYVWSL
ncbi:MAG: sulfur oxidation c-type cytochrome SoxX [Gammaproteobacteria bacterium]|nr:sulfur oxidation c-type cytochrome SoxX [Gammaproteobacteria bacterium]